MNKFKLISLLILAITSAFAYASVDVEKITNQISKNLYYRDKNVARDVQLREIEKVLQQLEAAISAEPENAAYLYLRGLANWSRLVILGGTLTTEEKQKLKKPAFESFRKALELDKGQPPQLTPDALYSLVTFGSSDIHVEAAHRIFKEDQSLEPKKELDMRGGVIQHLLRLERYDDVIKEIEIIEQKFPDTEYAKGARSHYTGVIEKVKQAALAKKTDQPKILVTVHGICQARA